MWKQSDPFYTLSFVLFDVCADGATILASPCTKIWQKRCEPPPPMDHFTMLLCLFQALLDKEGEELQHNERQERSSNNFNYGAYHSLESVSVSELVKIKVIALLVSSPLSLLPIHPYFELGALGQYPFTEGLQRVHFNSFLILGLFNSHLRAQ